MGRRQHAPHKRCVTACASTRRPRLRQRAARRYSLRFPHTCPCGSSLFSRHHTTTLPSPEHTAPARCASPATWGPARQRCALPLAAAAHYLWRLPLTSPTIFRLLFCLPRMTPGGGRRHRCRCAAASRAVALATSAAALHYLLCRMRALAHRHRSSYGRLLQHNHHYFFATHRAPYGAARQQHCRRGTCRTQACLSLYAAAGAAA